MEILYVQFIHPISVGGSHGSLPSWSRDRHGREIKISLEGDWIHLALNDEQYRRVPLHNVAYLSVAVKPQTKK